MNISDNSQKKKHLTLCIYKTLSPEMFKRTEHSKIKECYLKKNCICSILEIFSFCFPYNVKLTIMEEDMDKVVRRRKLKRVEGGKVVRRRKLKRVEGGKVVRRIKLKRVEGGKVCLLYTSPSPRDS